MPKLKRGHISPTKREDTKINTAILSDPETREMTDEDFEKAQLDATPRVDGKTRITIWVDSSIVAAFKARSALEGKGYQTLINEALRSAVADHNEPVTEASLRRILREELQHA